MNKFNGLRGSKAIYFISDAHLSFANGQAEDKIVQFLESIKTGASHLYIIGDLFDFWLEYKHAIPAAYLKTLAALLELTLNGTEVVYLPGNHDFWMVDYLERQAHVWLADERHDIQHFGKKIHLYHGDGLAYGDYGYRIIKKLFRFKPLVWLYKQLPADLAYRIAHKSSHASRQYTSQKPKDLHGYYDYAAEKIRSGYDVVIMGHTHVPEMKYIEDGLYINTGDWIEHFSYVVLTEEGFKLEYFNKEG